MPAPLAERMRPHTLENYIGQEHLVGENAVLRKSIQGGNIPSIIFWGPPGSGKTTLAGIIAEQTGREFFTLSAISSGVKDVREVIEKAKGTLLGQKMPPILFIDEIHRFSKSQQDSLLGAVERGTVTLIGATTENPSFEVISPLLSRCQVYILKDLNKDALLKILNHALEHDEILKKKKITLKETDALFLLSGGDARKLLNLVEMVVAVEENKNEIIFTDDKVMNIAQKKIALYDKQGEQHYDIISAFIKSMRGSDPNASVYWLARMIEGGEDPLFIARRMVILASEDIGNANPNALVLATSCFQAVHNIGYPECRIILSQTATYLAASPKSNASYMAIEEAADLVKRTGDQPVPLHLRNAPTRLMKDVGYGKDYKYGHSYEKNFTEQEYLPEKISGTKLYEPGENAREKEMRERLKELWKKKYNY